MQSAGGKTVLVVAGLVIIGIGAYHVYKGAKKKFLDDLHRSGLPRLATPLGVVGYIAKGLAIVGAGVLVVVATFTTDPSKASGLDGAVKTLGAAPFGQVLLVAAGSVSSPTAPTASSWRATGGCESPPAATGANPLLPPTARGRSRRPG